MKALFIIGCVLGLGALGIAQDAPRAHILGKVPDGTPPPPAPLKPAWVVPAEDVVREKSHAEGGRVVTVRQIKPIDLPNPPVPPEIPPQVETTMEFRERVAEYRKKYPRQRVLAIGAMVYRLDNGSTRSLVRASWGEGNADPVCLWSSGDFSLLSGIGSFTDKNGVTCSLFMTWSICDMKRIAAWMARTGREFKPPVIPELSEDRADFLVHEGSGDAALNTAIDALHEILNHDGAELRRAYEGRARAAREREEQLKANPPQPRDMIINYWLIEKPEAGGKGAQP